MCDSDTVINFGDKKVIKRIRRGKYGNEEKDCTLTFYLPPNMDLICIGCGYEHKKGMWHGEACEYNFRGDPHGYRVMVCPECSMETINA